VHRRDSSCQSPLLPPLELSGWPTPFFFFFPFVGRAGKIEMDHIGLAATSPELFSLRRRESGMSPMVLIFFFFARHSPKGSNSSAASRTGRRSSPPLGGENGPVSLFSLVWPSELGDAYSGEKKEFLFGKHRQRILHLAKLAAFPLPSESHQMRKEGLEYLRCAPFSLGGVRQVGAFLFRVVPAD